MIHEPKLEWFKSSYSSGPEGDSCIEVAWAKSSYSDGSEGDSCVEVGRTPAAVLVRDSKDTTIPHLAFSPTAWAGLIALAQQ
ncbi:DUF397 domain-containing protein [Streptomyces sp. NPDC090445]|uniref:DUF397 domain-containing protein n=1 Tax=Streptomyces sp. NPDC090445 TaxID=3365963 RepID=UPI00382B7D63